MGLEEYEETLVVSEDNGMHPPQSVSILFNSSNLTYTDSNTCHPPYTLINSSTDDMISNLGAPGVRKLIFLASLPPLGECFALKLKDR